MDLGDVLIFFLLFGGGEVVVRLFAPMLSGRKTIARLKADNRALKRELARVDQFAERMLENSGATVVTNPRHEALLWRVQATDTAVPQLPQDLRDDIDAELAKSTSASLEPVRKGKKA